MNLNKINIVAGREFKVRVKKKSFIIMTILTPIIFAALMIIPSVIMMNDMGEPQKNIMILDNSGIVASRLQSDESVTYDIIQNKNIDSLKQNFDQLGVDALVEITALDENNNFTITAYSTKQLSMEMKSNIKHAANDGLEKYKLAEYDIKDLKKILDDVKTNISVDNVILGEDGQETESHVEINMAISYILTFIIYMFVLMFGNMVMQSVIEEKSNRIVEILISSVKPFELMCGKIIGVAGVAIVQFLIWIILTGVLVFGFTATVGADMISNMTGNTEQVVQVQNSGAFDISSLAAAAGDSELGSILTTISNIDFSYILGCFFIYFILGYLLYASMFAAIGSAVENEADTQQLVMPITAPMIIGLFIMLHTFQHPDSALSFWASIFPYTSPMVMMARIPFEGGVPAWQLLLSIGLLLLFFIGTVYISGKIYRVGILKYGKKATWKDLWKWLKF
ncbi:MAG: ABC transporter permease [Bacteroidales bacterium]